MKIELVRYTKNPKEVAISAARISRTSKPLKHIISEALKDPEKTQERVERIFHGWHHTSPMEHAVFTFDLNVSKLTAMWLESFRHGTAFTESSLRYQNATFSDDFKSKFPRQVELYEKALNNDIPKEDARYILPLATPVRLILTVNARTLQTMQFYAPQGEPLNLVKEMISQVESLAQGLIKIVNPDYDRIVGRFINFRGGGIEKFKYLWLSDIWVSYKGECSGACLAQLSRHRTLTVYRAPSWNVVIPPTFTDKGLETEYLNLAEEMIKEAKARWDEDYNRLTIDMLQLLPMGATWYWQAVGDSNSWINLFNLRISKHAQWEIRSIAKEALDAFAEKLKYFASYRYTKFNDFND